MDSIIAHDHTYHGINHYQNILKRIFDYVRHDYDDSTQDFLNFRFVGKDWNVVATSQLLLNSKKLIYTRLDSKNIAQYLHLLNHTRYTNVYNSAVLEASSSLPRFSKDPHLNKNLSSLPLMISLIEEESFHHPLLSSYTLGSTLKTALLLLESHPQLNIVGIEYGRLSSYKSKLPDQNWTSIYKLLSLSASTLKFLRLSSGYLAPTTTGVKHTFPSLQEFVLEFTAHIPTVSHSIGDIIIGSPALCRLKLIDNSNNSTETESRKIQLLTYTRVHERLNTFVITIHQDDKITYNGLLRLLFPALSFLSITTSTAINLDTEFTQFLRNHCPVLHTLKIVYKYNEDACPNSLTYGQWPIMLFNNNIGCIPQIKYLILGVLDLNPDVINHAEYIGQYLFHNLLTSSLVLNNLTEIELDLATYYVLAKFVHYTNYDYLLRPIQPSLFAFNLSSVTKFTLKVDSDAFIAILNGAAGTVLEWILALQPQIFSSVKHLIIDNSSENSLNIETVQMLKKILLGFINCHVGLKSLEITNYYYDWLREQNPIQYDRFNPFSLYDLVELKLGVAVNQTILIGYSTTNNVGNNISCLNFNSMLALCPSLNHLAISLGLVLGSSTHMDLHGQHGASSSSDYSLISNNSNTNTDSNTSNKIDAKVVLAKFLEWVKSNYPNLNVQIT